MECANLDQPSEMTLFASSRFLVVCHYQRQLQRFARRSDAYSGGMDIRWTDRMKLCSPSWSRQRRWPRSGRLCDANGKAEVQRCIKPSIIPPHRDFGFRSSLFTSKNVRKSLPPHSLTFSRISGESDSDERPAALDFTHFFKVIDPLNHRDEPACFVRSSHQYQEKQAAYMCVATCRACDVVGDSTHSFDTNA